MLPNRENCKVVSNLFPLGFKLEGSAFSTYGVLETLNIVDDDVPILPLPVYKTTGIFSVDARKYPDNLYAHRLFG